MPQDRTPHVLYPPALTLMKVPERGLDWPRSGDEVPQHSTKPVRLTPQVWYLPALTVSNVPDGGLERS